MTNFLVTCEHGGNDVPANYQSLFNGASAARALRSHRGYDPGAFEAATQFAAELEVELIASKITRLLVDLNRSLCNPSISSTFSASVTGRNRAEMFCELYLPYRKRVEDELRRGLARSGRVIHLSIHTFTPRFKGVWRPMDVGLLFDPDRLPENSFCEKWRERMQRQHPRTRVAMNQPYAGKDDGFTTTLRGQFSAGDYLGIEVEINHRFWKRSIASQRKVVKALLDTLPDR